MLDLICRNKQFLFKKFKYSHIKNKLCINCSIYISENNRKAAENVALPVEAFHNKPCRVLIKFRCFVFKQFIYTPLLICMNKLVA